MKIGGGCLRSLTLKHRLYTFVCLQRALKLTAPEQLLGHISKHLKQTPYTLAELQSAECFGVHPNTLFEGDRKRAGAR